MGSLQEQMVAAMESRASSKSETAALRNVLSVVLTSSSSSSYSRSEKFNSCTPPEKKASPRSVRMQGAKSWACWAGWELHVLFQCTTHYRAGRGRYDHESCDQVSNTESIFPFPVPSPKCPSDQIQYWKSKGRRKLARPFYILHFKFSVPAFFIPSRCIFHATV